MKKTYQTLSMSLLLASALIISANTADAKTMNWAEDLGTDPEATLRRDPSNSVEGSLYIDSSANDNILNLNTGNVTGNVFGAYTSVNGAAATNNIVNIQGATIGSATMFSGNVSAGMSRYGDALYNTLNMSSGSAKFLITGGQSYSGHANYNTVNMSGGTVRDVVGGYVAYASADSAASYNTVNITGGTITGNIYGGDSNNGIDSNNTVNISGDVIISNISRIAGGTSASGSLQHPNNTLNLAWAGTVGSINHFENINFTVTDAVINNNNTALNITNTATITNSNIRLIALNNTTPLNIGDKITLLSKSSGDATLYSGSFRQGLARYLNYDMNYENGLTNSVVVNITDQGINPDTGDIPSAGGATSSLLKSGADLLDSAAFIDEVDGQAKLIAIVKHSRSKVGSDSGFNTNGTSMLLGSSHKFPGQGGYVMLGGFLETGHGNFDTYSNFSDGAEIHSSGKSSYHGAGIAMSNIRDSGVYTKLNVRLGRAFTRYNSANLTDNSNDAANYNSATVYYGANISFGKITKLGKNNTLDVYGKYMFLHQNGATVNILDDTFELKPINSHRVRVGGKLSNSSNKQINSYIDLAYEYEFAGQAKAFAYGVELPYVSTKGGTAIAEIGMVYKPKNMSKFETKLAVQGYMGKRQGMGGNVELKWKF